MNFTFTFFLLTISVKKKNFLNIKEKSYLLNLTSLVCDKSEFKGKNGPNYFEMANNGLRLSETTKND